MADSPTTSGRSPSSCVCGCAEIGMHVSPTSRRRLGVGHGLIGCLNRTTTSIGRYAVEVLGEEISHPISDALPGNS